MIYLMILFTDEFCQNSICEHSHSMSFWSSKCPEQPGRQSGCSFFLYQ